VLQRLALEIIGSAIFSLEMEEYEPRIRKLILSYTARLGRPSLLDFLMPVGIPSPYDLARHRFRRRWMALIEQIIADRRHRGSRNSHRDLFDLLEPGHPEDADLTGARRSPDQVTTLIVAGHETTASALFWALYLLAVTPVEQEALAAEAETVDPDPTAAADVVPQLIRNPGVRG